eukprot:1128069-Pelagomonas_calceolata.AAC.2
MAALAVAHGGGGSHEQATGSTPRGWQRATAFGAPREHVRRHLVWFAETANGCNAMAGSAVVRI